MQAIEVGNIVRIDHEAATGFGDRLYISEFYRCHEVGALGKVTHVESSTLGVTVYARFSGEQEWQFQPYDLHVLNTDHLARWSDTGRQLCASLDINKHYLMVEGVSLGQIARVLKLLELPELPDNSEDLQRMMRRGDLFGMKAAIAVLLYQLQQQIKTDLLDDATYGYDSEWSVI